MTANWFDRRPSDPFEPVSTGLIARGGCGGDWCEQTRFELDPDSGIVLDLLDHLAVPADDDADGEARDWNLRGRGLQLCD